MGFKQGGQAIQRIRRERGMTQEQLAEIANAASNSISRMERKLLMPALPTLIAICNALGTRACLKHRKHRLFAHKRPLSPSKNLVNRKS